MLILAIATIVYAVLDFTFRPDLAGNIDNFLLGLLTSAVAFYFWWSYRTDAEEADRLESELNRLRLEFEELQNKIENRREQDR
jgi:hypothetical protein